MLSGQACFRLYVEKIVAPPVGGVFINTPCDSQIVAAEGFKSIMEVEPFIIDVPYSVGEKELHYVAKQLREQIKYLEQVTGKNSTGIALKPSARKQSNGGAIVRMERLAKIPCPQMSKVVTFGFVLLNTLSGTNGHLVCI